MSVLFRPGVDGVCPRLTNTEYGLKRFWTGTVCRTVINFTTIAVDGILSSGTTILVSSVIRGE